MFRSLGAEFGPFWHVQESGGWIWAILARSIVWWMTTKKAAKYGDSDVTFCDIYCFFNKPIELELPVMKPEFCDQSVTLQVVHYNDINITKRNIAYL